MTNIGSSNDGFCPEFTDPARRSKLEAAFPQLGEIFSAFVEQKHVPGLAFGVVIDGELTYSGCFGLRSVRDQAPVTMDSVFRIASMSKSFTAMAVIKLRDEGKLALDTAARVYVPELSALAYPTADSAPVTVRQLLTMGGGFPQDDPWADRQLALPEDQLSAQLRGGLPFSTPPGTTFEYSNYGYAILGRVVTNVSGMPYQHYIRQHILEPLHMASSTFDVRAVSGDRLAMGYRAQEGQWVEEAPLADGTFGAMGGLFTTIPDFARYMAFLLSAFPARDAPESGPIRRSSAREMQQGSRQAELTGSRPVAESPLVVSNRAYGYGLSCILDSLFGYSVAHGGGLPGYGSFYRLLPYCGLGLVVFTNRTYESASGLVEQALTAMRAAGGLSVRKLLPARILLDVRDTLDRLYDQWDDAGIRNAASDTFFMDMPLDKRREQFEKLRATFGKRLATGEIEPENALRGRWSLTCEQGRIDLFVTLSPTIPPRIQYLSIASARPLSRTQRRAILQLLRLIQQWDDARFRQVFGSTARRRVIERHLDAIRVQYGRLRLGDVVEGDGESHAIVNLHGERADVDLRIVTDPGSGKVHEFGLLRPHGSAFMA